MKIKVSAQYYKDPDSSTTLFWTESKEDLLKQMKNYNTKEYLLEYLNCETGEVFVSGGDDLAIHNTATRLFPGE